MRDVYTTSELCQIWANMLYTECLLSLLLTMDIVYVVYSRLKEMIIKLCSG